MFGIGTKGPATAVATEEEQKEPVPVPTIGELVRSFGTKNTEGKMDHLLDLTDTTGRLEYAGMSRQTYGSLIRKGFTWFVDASFINNFPYHALLCTRKQIESARDFVKKEVKGLVWYTGDVPKFALERIRAAQEAGMDTFTIHSHQPLPVRLEHCDPVLVGWAMYPRINGNPMQCQAGGFGVVVAVWNFDDPVDLS